METPSQARLWTGRILSGIAVLFMTMDGMVKVLRLAPALQGTVELGYPESAVVPIGILALIGVVLYAIPRTSVLGAIWLTGFLGGAVATHVRVGNPLFTHTIFPTYVAALMWGGLVLRRPRVLDVLLRGE
jgi:hypothetical protein